MALKAVTPFYVKGKFNFGADEYTGHVSKFEFQPSQSTVTYTDLDGTVYSYPGPVTWVLVLNLAQDWTTNGLTNFLLANVGATGNVQIQTAQANWAATVANVPPTIGGDTGTIAQATITLPLTGAPVRSNPTP